MTFRILLIYCFLLVSQLGLAQTLVLPYDIADKRTGKTQIQQVTFYAYPYQNENIDLRDFKRREPRLQAPDFMMIKGPELMGRKNLTVLIGLIEGVESNEDALIIWLAADYETNNITFFLDNNLDRVFNEKDRFFKLSSTDAAVVVTVKPEKGNIPAQKLSLKVPHQKAEYKDTSTPNSRSKRKLKIINKLAIGLNVGVGVGSLSYRYDNLDIGFPTWYDVNLTEKSVGATLSYNLRYLRFAISANYENTFTYTSYLNFRFDEPEERINSTTGPRIIENVSVDRNLDKHSTHHFQYAMTLGLRLHPTKGMEFQPFVTVGQINYMSGQYSSNRYTDDMLFDLPSRYFYDLGLRVEFTTAAYQAFYLDLIYQNRFWRPEGFFELIPHNNLEISNQIWKMTFGYRFGL